LHALDALPGLRVCNSAIQSDIPVVDHARVAMLRMLLVLFDPLVVFDSLVLEEALNVDEPSLRVETS
jgi:hypothetical protein